jgi:probable F420-dependent oxidoreductase
MSIEIGGRRIRFGLWYDFRNPLQWRRPPADVYGRTLEHIRFAERLNFDDIWTSEHHFIDDEYSPSLLPICGAIAAATSRVRIGTNVLLLPLHDPVRVAEDAATVDALSGGRFDLGVAIGYKLEEFAGFGVDRRTRANRMEEAVAIIRRCWGEGAFTFHGKHYRYDNIDVRPKPVQQPMPLWMGGFVEPAVRRAGRLGDGFLGAANVIETFVDEWTKHHSDAPERIALSLPFAAVSRDPEATWAEIGEHVVYQRRRYGEWFGAAGMGVAANTPATAAEMRERTPDVVVTPGRAREIVEGIVARLPVTHLYWWAIPPGVPADRMWESAELFASEMSLKDG